MIVAIIVISIVLAVALVVFFVGRAVRRYNLPQPVTAGALQTPAKRQKGIKGFFISVKDWFVTHKPCKRRLIQIYAALLYNANIKGFISGNIYDSATTKYLCVPGLNCYSCPGAVGSCPIGALQNALSATNTRAPYYVLGIFALFGIMLARTVCGFLCPVGLGQELLYKIRTPKLKKGRVTRVLSYFKYIILVLMIAVPLIYAVANVPLPAFCKYICPAGTLGGAVMLLLNPNNTGVFAQLGWQFTWKFSLLIAFIVASIFIFRFFCRFFCPLGAIYGFFNKFAFIGVTVDKNNCTDCGLCVAHCKMDVKHVGDHECINCGECMSVCPTKAIHWKGSTVFLRLNNVPQPEISVKPPLTVDGGKVRISGAADPAAADMEVGDPINMQAADTMTAVESIADNTQDAAVDTVKQTDARIDFEESAEQPAAETEVAATASKPKRRVTFWLEVAAWAVALVVLVVALVCYNFVDVAEPYTPPVGNDDIQTGYNVGDIAPDFTVKLYGGDGEFNLYANKGNITVINFWATWCTPCVKEIPFFNELTENHPELTVIAIHGTSDEDVQAYINKNWGGYSLTFAQDNLEGLTCLTFRLLGGTNYWPNTVIVDAEGKVIYNSILSFESYDQLESTVLGAIENSAQSPDGESE